MAYQITITQKASQFFVRVEFPGGFAKVQMCDTEEQARAYARGLLDGICMVKNMIDIGPQFDTQIRKG